MSQSYIFKPIKKIHFEAARVQLNTVSSIHSTCDSLFSKSCEYEFKTQTIVSKQVFPKICEFFLKLIAARAYCVDENAKNQNKPTNVSQIALERQAGQFNSRAVA